MSFHRSLIVDDIHALSARIYADITARDADTDFQVTENISKLVRVDGPVEYYLLVSVSPAVWVEISNTGNDSWLKLNDTPSDYIGDAGNIIQVNEAASGLEFGQALRTTDSPLFNNLTISGNLTVQGATTILDTGTLRVEDNNIAIGDASTGPTDVTADGGGLTLFGDTDKTIKWVNATNRWTFNQGIDLQGNNLISTGGLVSADVISGNITVTTGNLQLSGNTLSSINGDIDITTDTGGVFKFESNALRAGQSTIDYIELGHNSFDSFINAVGAGGLLFAFNGAARVEFTDAGHLHLKTSTDQKDVLKLKTFNNLNETGIAWQNSIVGYTQTIYRKDIGGNRADLHFAGGLDNNIDLLTDSFKIHGGSGVEGNLEIFGALKIASGGPASGNVLTSDASGNATWEVPSATAGGWTDDGTVVRLTTSTDKVGIGTTSPNATLDVTGSSGTSVGGFASGQFHVTNPSAVEFTNSVITGHNSFNGNTQLWYLGNTSSSNNHIALINRQNGDISLSPNNVEALRLVTNGNAGFGITPFSRLHVFENNTNISTTAGITIENAGTGDALLHFVLAANRWVMGVDNSDGDKFKMSSSAGFTTDLVYTIDPVTRNFGIGGTPTASAKLDVASTTEGFLPPRMTTAQRDAIVSPATGLEIYNTTIDKPEFFNSTGWVANTNVARESFASTNARFFGELGLPTAQGWTNTSTGSVTIDLVNKTVNGVLKQVVKVNDSFSDGRAGIEFGLSAQNWTDINTFGASFGGKFMIESNQNLPVGLHASTADNPVNPGTRERYAFNFEDASGFVQVNVRNTETTFLSEILDGSGGSPVIPIGTFFDLQVVIPSGGIANADVYVNGEKLGIVASFVTDNSAVTTSIINIGGATSSTNFVSFVDNLGVTIFEESATKTLLSITMDADIAQVIIPDGKRDYTIILPDGNPRDIGNSLEIVANNVFGTVTLTNQNLAVPEILYNGLRTLVLNVNAKENIKGINTINNSNVYVGFQAEDIDRTPTIFAQLNSSVDQLPADTNPTVITYNTQDAINNIKHSTTINPGELEILPGFGGTYFVSPQPQVGKSSGGAAAASFDMFLQVDRGTGFADEANSNIKLTIKDTALTDVIVSALSIQLNVGDKIRMMQVVSDAGVGLGLTNTDPIVGPPSVPRTPSIIFTMYRIGGI